MIVFFLALAVCVVVGMHLFPRGEWHEVFLSKSATQPIKGIFILWVFFSHVMSYIGDASAFAGSWPAKLYWLASVSPRQLVVVMFLFYSGYGITESAKAKGAAYIAAIPRKRILGTLLRFDLAVLVFVISGLLLHHPLAIKQVALSFLAWDSVGNSHWYIFTILSCYFAAWISFSLFGVERKGLLALFLAIVALACGLSLFQEPYWYDTILAFPFGAFVSVENENLQKFVRGRYCCVLCTVFIVMVALHASPWANCWPVMNIESVFFAAFVVLVSMKVSICSRFLSWCGVNLFVIYIYQRLPMCVLASLLPDFVRQWPSLFILASLFSTFFVVLGYNCLSTLWYNYRR